MNRQAMEWKLDVERLWSAAALDFREAGRLAAEIFTLCAETALRQAAAEALPSLRNAALENADRSTKDEARGRFSVIRDVLCALDAGTFGRRDSAPKPLTEEARYRQLLGLPLGRRLARAEIHRAWKRAVKTAHPDAGGDASEFVALSAAQEALMKER
ncbi:MAG: hypothetical protein E7813_02260 [Bradyrhizobium sp.]|uniref:hypothetical protein n=1 Tax=Bradyrhizobium sp. TaxID=376 RepID=UPI0011F54667|nr:hypothetical protein [Bradyrhizobium sp.]THD73684.1 MAG: hypothetical protein E7813_02260 [Bradyrhizobium sp.]